MVHINFTPLDRTTQKVKEAILYIASQCKDDETFCATMLNKVLFRADLNLFLRTAKTVTGRAHWKLKNGPALKCLVPVREEMKQGGLLKIEHRPFKGYMQERPVALRAPDMSLFAPAEVEALKEAIVELRGQTATAVSRLSHEWFNWWKLLRLKETVDLGMALFRKPKRIPAEVLQRAMTLMRGGA